MVDLSYKNNPDKNKSDAPNKGTDEFQIETKEWTVSTFGIDQCERCKHYRGGIYCDAFTGGLGIPDKIIAGTYDHTEPFEGDNGIRFKEKDLEKTKK